VTAVTFQGFTPSDALRHAVQRHACHLDRVNGDVGSCLINFKSHSLRRKKRFKVDIRVSAQGREVPHVHGLDKDDPYDALMQAFDALTQRLENNAARQAAPRSYIPLYPVL